MLEGHYTAGYLQLSQVYLFCAPVDHLQHITQLNNFITRVRIFTLSEFNARQVLYDRPYLSQHLPLKEGPDMALLLRVERRICRSYPTLRAWPDTFSMLNAWAQMLPDEPKLSSLRRAATYSRDHAHHSASHAPANGVWQ